MSLRVLAVGDVVSEYGVAFLRKHLRSLKKIKQIDFTVVNGENAAGLGITPALADAIFQAGADVITLGNHTWNKKEIFKYLDDCPYILRPSNFAPQTPGRGWAVLDTSFGQVLIINLIGRCEMPFGPDNPFFEADKIIKANPCRFTFIDMHAEATSEKLAMGFYLDGRASAVWGTHTHVQTSDAGLLPSGTGYITDIGMTGPAISVLGITPERSISMFLGNPGRHYEPADGPCKMECALFTLDENSGLCTEAEALRITD